MESDLLQRLADESQSYSKRQRAIARYICENSETVPFMTSRMLSQAAQVSESSVVRFARQLGFSGYSQLRRALQQLVKDKLGSVKEAEAETDMEELKQTLELGRLGLGSIATAQNRLALEKAAELLSNGEKILVQAGLGMEGLDTFIASGLRSLGYNAGPASAGLSREVFRLDEKSVLLIVCGSFCAQVSGSARYAKEKGAAVLVLTGDEAAPMGRYAEVMLPGKGFIALAALIEALFKALESRCGRSLLQNLRELETLCREYDTYEAGES